MIRGNTEKVQRWRPLELLLNAIVSRKGLYFNYLIFPVFYLFVIFLIFFSSARVSTDEYFYLVPTSGNINPKCWRSQKLIVSYD